MIRILIADRFPARTIDLLNEIVEFEIIEKPGLPSARLQEEIRNADAVVISAAMSLDDEILKSADDLKLIVRCGGAPESGATSSARDRGIEVRQAAGQRTGPAGEAETDAAGSDVIAILKDFFNV